MLHHPFLLEVPSAVIRCSCTIVAMRPTANPERHLERAWPSARSSSASQRQPIEIDGHHLVDALLCHLFDEQELAVICVYADAVQVPELPLDRGEHRVQVGEIADVRADGETSGSKRLLSRLQPPLVQAADGDARAPSVDFLRCGQTDPAVAAGDRDITTGDECNVSLELAHVSSPLSYVS